MRRLVTALAALTLVGCGVPLDSEPETVDIEAVADPDDDGPVLGDLSAVSMYLVRDEALVPVTRDLPSPPKPEIVLGSLLGDITEPERRSNLRTAIPPRTRALGIVIEDTVLRVDLSREFASVGGEEETLAVAQIVLTATGIEGVDLVAFELEGVPTDVPVASGALSVDPVGASDYEGLIAPQGGLPAVSAVNAMSHRMPLAAS